MVLLTMGVITGIVIYAEQSIIKRTTAIKTQIDNEQKKELEERKLREANDNWVKEL